MMEQLTFENHLMCVHSGPYASIEKILAVQENAHGPIEVIKQRPTTATFKYSTKAGFESAYKKK